MLLSKCATKMVMANMNVVPTTHQESYRAWSPQLRRSHEVGTVVTPPVQVGEADPLAHGLTSPWPAALETRVYSRACIPNPSLLLFSFRTLKRGTRGETLHFYLSSANS